MINEFSYTYGPSVAIDAVGFTMLSQHRRTKKWYDMKIQSKHLLRTTRQAPAVEAQALHRIRSPFIPQLYDVFQNPAYVFLVLQRIQGLSLEQHLQRHPTFEEPHVRLIAAEMVLALEAIHRKKYIHGQVTLKNMIMDDTGHIKLVAFGSVHPIGAGSATPAHDWGALGQCMYKLLSGTLPDSSSFAPIPTVSDTANDFLLGEHRQKGTPGLSSL